MSNEPSGPVDENIPFLTSRSSPAVDHRILREITLVLAPVPFIHRIHPHTMKHDEGELTSVYHLYLAMQEPQKRHHIYKETTRRIVSVCGTYGLKSLGFEDAQRRSEKYFAARRWYAEVLRAFELWASWDLLTALLKRENILDGLERLIRTVPSSVIAISSRGDADERDKLAIFRANESHRLQKTGISEVVECLQMVLSAQDELKQVLRLRDASAQSFLDLLDNAVSQTGADTHINSQCQHALRRLCGRAGLLPSSYVLSDGLSKDEGHPITAGGFADVYLGWYKGQKVALKALRVYGKENLEKVQKTFCKEAVFWRRLTHPNIAPFLGVSEAKLFPLCMVSTWMEHGNLATYIRRQPQANRLDLLVDVARGLLHLHRLGMVHGDVKSANVLINEDRRACLTDFGLACITHDARTASLITTSTALHGSIRWMAPELLHPEQAGRDDARASAESDIYAMAMVILEVFTGNIPFCHHARDATVVLDVTLGIRPERPGPEAAARGLSDLVWSVVEACWQTEWRRRPRMPFVLRCLEEAQRHFVPAAVDNAEGAVAGAEDSDSEHSTDDDASAPFRKDFTKPRPDAAEDIEAYPIFSVAPDAQRLHVGLETSAVVNLPDGFERLLIQQPAEALWGNFDDRD